MAWIYYSKLISLLFGRIKLPHFSGFHTIKVYIYVLEGSLKQTYKVNGSDVDLASIYTNKNSKYIYNMSVC